MRIFGLQGDQITIVGLLELGLSWKVRHGGEGGGWVICHSYVSLVELEG